MDEEPVQLAELIAYAEADGRICPNPPEWNALWILLRDSKKPGAWPDPAAPLVLAAWWHTSDEEKRFRLREHIGYAASHQALGAVDKFLRGLTAAQWHLRQGE